MQMNDPDEQRWEAVHTVHEYYDGPRVGVADYQGVPHVYKCAWDEAADDWEAAYALVPITPDQFRMVLEEWSIWRRYKATHDAGELRNDDEHPALASDRARYDEIHPRVAAFFDSEGERAIRAVPEFRGRMEPTHTLQVRWTDEPRPE